MGLRPRVGMSRKRKSETRDAEVLAPVPVELLDRFVREGPLTQAKSKRPRAAQESDHRAGARR